MKCIIPCAGESSRMSYLPKYLVRIGDKPLLLHIVDIWKDYVDSFVFILKRSATYLWEYLPSNSIIVFQDEPNGLADAILQAEKCVDGKFVVALSDCLHKGTFIEEMFATSNFNLGVGVWKTDILDEVNKSYLVEAEDERVTRVIEKPDIHSADISGLSNCGMGTYFLDTRVFDYICNTIVVPGGGDFTDVIQHMIDMGEKVVPMWFEGKYINVTHPEDLRKAEELLA